MKTIFFLFIYSALNLSAFEYPFDVERLNVDFNGICTNQSSIIAYGTGSMILRTTDDGNTWEQIKVAHDSLEIMKIINLNDNYYGILADNYLVSSTDNGKSWKTVKINENIIYDINSSIDRIYLLSDNQVLVFDLDFNYIETLKIEYMNSGKKFLVTKNNILIPQNSDQLIIYNIKNRKHSGIISFKDLGLCDQCTEPFNLIYDGTTTVMTIDNGNIIKSIDEGFSWAKIASAKSGIGKLIGSNYYVISSGSSINYSGFPIVYKIDSLKSSIISDDGLDRLIVYENLILTDYIQCNNNIFLAVGRNKTILKSSNGGINWFVVSHFPYSGFNYWVDDLNCYNYTYNGIVYHTFNGGLTWLPQKTVPVTYNDYFDYKLSYFDYNGNGFLYKPYSFNNKSNIMITRDFANTFEYLNNDNIRMNLPDLMYLPRLIKSDSGIVILNNMMFSKDHYTTIYSIDNSFNYISYSILDSMVICGVYRQDNDYIAIGLERRLPGPGLFDEDTFAIRQNWILNSSDNGRTWSKVKSFKYIGTLLDSYIIDDNVLFYSSSKSTKDSNYLDYFLHNLNLKTFDLNLYLFSDSMSYMSSFLKYDSLFLINGYYSNFQNNNYLDDMNNWVKTETTPYIFSNEYSGKKVSYLTGRFHNKLCLFKLMPKDTATEVKIEIQTAFFANPPYPIPAKNYVSCQIFWDQRYDIDFSIFKVYNIYGSIVSDGEDISLNKSNAYSGVLTWTPSSAVPVGTYYIKINHGDAVKVVPVILMR